MGLLLPAVAQAVSAEQNGQTQNEALSSVMPQLLQVTLLCSFLMHVLYVILFAWYHRNKICMRHSLHDVTAMDVCMPAVDGFLPAKAYITSVDAKLCLL